MPKFSKHTDASQEEFGFSDDFATLILAGETVAALFDLILQGEEVTKQDIGFVVDALGTTIGLITVKYDPAVQR